METMVNNAEKGNIRQSQRRYGKVRKAKVNKGGYGMCKTGQDRGENDG